MSELLFFYLLYANSKTKIAKPIPSKRVSKPSKKQFVWYKPTTWRLRYKVLIIGLLSIVILINISNYKADYDERNKIIEIVGSVREIKADLEKELGISLRESNGCTQNKGLYDGPDASWGCSIALKGEIAPSQEQLISKVAIKNNLVEKSSSARSEDTSNKKVVFANALLNCGAIYGSNPSFYCSFGSSNKNIEFTKKELNLTN